jgi:hypothetical protein
MRLWIPLHQHLPSSKFISSPSRVVVTQSKVLHFQPKFLHWPGLGNLLEAAGPFSLETKS